MSYCSNCGRSLLNDAACCTECGANVIPSPPEAAGQTASAAPTTAPLSAAGRTIAWAYPATHTAFQHQVAVPAGD